MAKKEKQENKKPVLVLDDKEYHYDNLEEDQKVMVAHINDLNRKIDGTTFNLQQLQYGRQAFINTLKESLEKEKEEES